MGEGDTLVNALIGGAIMIFGGWIPLVPVLGGAVAAYLEGGSREDAVRIGAYAGIVGFLPSLLGILVVGGILGISVGFFAFESLAFGAFGAVAFVLFAVAAVLLGVYFVGLGALGGWLGHYVEHDTDVDI